MHIRVPLSRNTLDWHKFRRTDSEDWLLVLPRYYASVFQFIESELMDKSTRGWHSTKNERYEYTIFASLSDDDLARIQQFISDYQKIVAIGLNKNIEPSFSDELDCCMALDYNFEADYGKRVRTELGDLEYRAKYQQEASAVRQIVEHIVLKKSRMPFPLSWSDTFLSYVPSSKPRGVFYLPRILCEKVLETTADRPAERPRQPVLHSEIVTDVERVKNMTVDEKIASWDNVVSGNCVKLSGRVDGCTVCVIDDLYQSGASMWSYAKFLKSEGAACVLGLAVVKSWSDSSNV